MLVIQKCVKGMKSYWRKVTIHNGQRSAGFHFGVISPVDIYCCKTKTEPEKALLYALSGKFNKV